MNEQVDVLQKLSEKCETTAEKDRLYICGIGRLFWGDSKQCYAADAVYRKVVELSQLLTKVQSDLDASKKWAQSMEEAVDNVRAALGLDSTHWLIIHDQVAEVVEERDRLNVKIAEYEKLAKQYHNGYNIEMQQEVGMKEPASPLEAFEELLDEKNDIDTAGLKAKLTMLMSEVKQTLNSFEELLGSIDEHQCGKKMVNHIEGEVARLRKLLQAQS